MTNMETRIAMMVLKALVTKTDDSNDLQLLKIDGLSEEVQGNIERLQNYGLSSNPPKDSDALALLLNGDRAHGVVICADNAESRVNNLKDGEVVLYSKHGHKILLREDGKIVVTGEVIFEDAATFKEKAVFEKDADIKGALDTTLGITTDANITAKGIITAAAISPATQVGVSTHEHVLDIPNGKTAPPTAGT